MEAWLSFHDVTTVQNCEARVLDFHCKHMTYTAAIELSDLMKGECPTPSSAKATINTDHNSNIKNILLATRGNRTPGSRVGNGCNLLDAQNGIAADSN